MARPQGNPQAFAPEQRVRYRPGHGTYGYEDAIEQDGRIPATVIGHTPTRVRIRFNVPSHSGIFRPRTIERAVDAASLEGGQ